MENILLPTDLSVQSLYPIHKIVKEANGEEISIKVVHLLSLPTSITDLLSLRENKLYSSLPESFIEAFQMLCNKYKSEVERIDFEFVYCNTTRYMNNFIEANNIKAVYFLSNYKYTEPLSQSVNFTSYLNKAKVPVHKIPLQSAAVSDYQNLSVLLNSNEHFKESAGNRLAKTAVSYL